MWWRWGRVFVLHTLELKFYAADNSRHGVVDQRADGSHDEPQDAVEQWQTDHHANTHRYGADATATNLADQPMTG